MKVGMAVTGTVAARIVATMLNLAVIALAANRSGAQGVGEISLIVLAITIIMLLNNLVGGGAITWLAPRFNIQRILLPAYAWAVATAFLAYLITYWIPLVPSIYRIHVVVLAFLQSIYTAHLNILLGREGVGRFNIILASQVFVLLAAYVFLTQGHDLVTAMSYVHASYFAFGFSAVVTLIMVIPLWRNDEITETEGLTRGLLGQGGLMQLANLMQLMNYRLAYYFIEHFVGLATLGIYSVGTQLSEGAWMVPKSIGTVVYSKVSQLSEHALQRQLTKNMLKIAMAACAAVLLVLLMLPEPIYQFIFGEEVYGISPLILMLSPGILAMAGAQALSHYFSGIGENRHNTISSGIALLITIGLGVYLIPEKGMIGAAIATSVAYSMLFLYQVVIFIRMGVSEQLGEVVDPDAT